MTELQILHEDIASKFQSKFGHKPTLISSAPGRINIIGEHTDYNLGLSMPAGINRWVIIAYRQREDHLVKIFSESFGTEMDYLPTQAFTPSQSWQKYIYGALEIFQKTDKITHGFDAYIWGNVPLGSGVSSSAAIEVAMMGLLRHVFNAKFSDTELVKNCQQIEHQYLGVKSGLLDQYASQFSKAGKLMALDFQSLSHTYADAEMDDWCWVLANTKVKRELAGSKYSERVEETQKALQLLKSEGVNHFRDITLAHVDKIQDSTIKKRIKHFVTENQRVHDMAAAFKVKNYVEVGNLLYASHESLKSDYEVSCAELDYLVELCKNFSDAAGARMMGGGFGGCTINLVKKSALLAFEKYVTTEYKAKFNIVSEVYAFDVVEGAKVYSV